MNVLRIGKSKVVAPNKIKLSDKKYPIKTTRKEIFNMGNHEVTLSELFSDAEWPIYVTGYWEPRIIITDTDVGNNYIYRELGKEKVYLVNVERDYNKKDRARYIIEVLANSFFDYLCTQSVCERGYFYPELFQRKLIEEEKELVND